MEEEFSELQISEEREQKKLGGSRMEEEKETN